MAKDAVLARRDDAVASSKGKPRSGPSMVMLAMALISLLNIIFEHCLASGQAESKLHLRVPTVAPALRSGHVKVPGCLRYTGLAKATSPEMAKQ